MRCSRDVPLDDIDTISHDMTDSIMHNRQDSKYLTATPQLSPKKQSRSRSRSPINERLLNINIVPENSCDETIHVDTTNLTKEDNKLLTYYKSPKYQRTFDTPERKELLWTTKIENVIKGWHNNCLKFAEIHNEHAKYHKKIFYTLSITAAIIPIILASTNELFVGDYQIIENSLLILTGILTTIGGFLNPGRKSEDHMNFEALYNELAVEITSELVKPQGHRQDADVFIQKIMDRYNNLNNRAPTT